jgi:hypothetical protein
MRRGWVKFKALCLFTFPNAPKKSEGLKPDLLEKVRGSIRYLETT